MGIGRVVFGKGFEEFMKKLIYFFILQTVEIQLSKSPILVFIP
jgi:hypothetical protein